MHPALLLTRDEALREEVSRLAAASGASLDPVGDAASALRLWGAAPLVLVGCDVLGDLAALGPPRRDGVHVVARSPSYDGVFREALVVGAETHVELPEAEGWLVETLTDLADAATVRGRVLGVIGGSGGAGATTLACALGQCSARSGAAVVIDCDPLGPGVDRILGLEELDGFRWDALSQTTGRLSSRSLREALPSRAGLAALSWRSGSESALSPFAVREALSAARRGHGTVVLDLPRTLDPLVGELVSRCDLTLLVVRSTVAGVASAARLRVLLGDGAALGVVLRGRGPAGADVARVVGAPLLATMPDQRGLAESIDLGLGPIRSWRGPLARACEGLLTGEPAGWEGPTWTR